MTDDELINNMAENLEKVLNATLEGNGLHAVQNMAIKDKFYRLIELSRIGASVMPRPIEEAPDDGTPVLAIIGNGYNPCIVHYEHERGWCHLESDFSVAPINNQPITFVPLSAFNR